MNSCRIMQISGPTTWVVERIWGVGRGVRVVVHNGVLGDNGSDFTYEAIKKGDKLPLDSLNM